MGAATVLERVSALAPGKVAEMITVGGVISGYWATGMIVITVGNRGGHPNRSKWYHNYGYGNLRDYGLEDQKYAIQQLGARHPFIDLDRVGIHGHSGGGFMSTAAILKYPDFFFFPIYFKLILSGIFKRSIIFFHLPVQKFFSKI